MTVNLRMHCGTCGLKQMNPLDLIKDPFHDRAFITLSKNVSRPDPRNPENEVRVIENETHLQEPALICTGCYSDATDAPTAEPHFVSKKK